MANPLKSAAKTAGKVADFFGGVTRYDKNAPAPIGSLKDTMQRKAKNSTGKATDDGKMQKVMKENKVFGAPAANVKSSKRVARY